MPPTVNKSRNEGRQQERNNEDGAHNDELGTDARHPSLHEFEFLTREKGDATGTQAGLIHTRGAAQQAPIATPGVGDHLGLSQRINELFSRYAFAVHPFHCLSSTPRNRLSSRYGVTCGVLRVRVATFNVNSLRARLPVFLHWLDTTGIDVVALQEIKTVEDTFPRAEIEERGYHLAIHGQKTYNGVAILSRTPMEDVVKGLPGEAFNQDARVISATINGVRIVNTYVPNGTKIGSDKFAYKLAWLEHFDEVMRQIESGPALWLGDINIAPTSDDLFEPEKKLGVVGYHPEEHVRLARLTDRGWTDVFRRDTKGPGHYTFWEYMIPNGFKRNLGWRIDHIYATPSLLDRCQDCYVDKDPRGMERPSDHTPVVVTVNPA